MTKEFDDWTSYDRWLISTGDENTASKGKANFDLYFINSISETDGKLTVDFEIKT